MAALNLLGFVAGRKAALNEGVDTSRANQLGLVSGLLPNPVVGTLIAAKIADDETPPPAPPRDDSQTTDTTTVFATSTELATLRNEIAAIDRKLGELERRLAAQQTPPPPPPPPKPAKAG